MTCLIAQDLSEPATLCAFATQAPAEMGDSRPSRLKNECHAGDTSRSLMLSVDIVAAATIVQLRLERQLALLERPVHGPHLLAFERKDFAVLNATMIVPREKHMCFIKTGRLPEGPKNPPH